MYIYLIKLLSTVIFKHDACFFTRIYMRRYSYDLCYALQSKCLFLSMFVTVKM